MCYKLRVYFNGIYNNNNREPEKKGISCSIDHGITFPDALNTKLKSIRIVSEFFLSSKNMTKLMFEMILLKFLDH